MHAGALGVGLALELARFFDRTTRGGGLRLVGELGRGVARPGHRLRHLGDALRDLVAQALELGLVGDVDGSAAAAAAEILELARHRRRRGRGLGGGARRPHALARRGLGGERRSSITARLSPAIAATMSAT